ncbi:MAG TPA: glycosyltransferase family 2 protein [Verrucomicrobiae bacterium]|nr:glycosyltransferase family 2 protein [Verrucomicrobiae bacterium]
MKAQAFILHWNRPESCAETVRLFLQCPGLAVGVLDNGSHEGHLAKLKTLLGPIVEIMPLGSNLGWGAGLNRGLKRWLENDRTPFCFVSADDARPALGALEKLLSAMEAHGELGVLCPQYDVAQIGVFSPIRGPRLMPSQAGRNGTIHQADFAHGTLTLFRRECLMQIGLFDESYFAYGDEMELSLRAKRAGWAVGLLRGAAVRNPETKVAADVVQYLSSRNSLQLAARYGGGGQAIIRALLMLLNSGRMLCLPKSWRNRNCLPIPRLAAVRDYFLGRTGPPPNFLII